MRKFTLPAFILLSVCANSYAQRLSMNGPPVAPRDLSAYQNVVNINGQDGFYLKKDLYLVDHYTMIDGQRVLGIPFLFEEWLDGSLTTPDGRVYTDYKYRYNAENQTIHFLNGKDSMEANEEIKEFTLKVAKKDSVITLRFIHANQYQKRVNQPAYYEVLLDNEKGQLLKHNRKVVTNVGDGILAVRTSKYLKLEPIYYYYDKQNKKLTRIRETSDVSSLLHLSPEDSKELHTDSFDFGQEENIIRFFKLYFEKTKLKGF
jgi:hypothetical protein